MEIDIVPNNKLPVYFLCMNQILGGIDFILSIFCSDFIIKS